MSQNQINPNLAKKLSKIEFSIRTWNWLKDQFGDSGTVLHLVLKTEAEVMRDQRFTRKMLTEIKAHLEDMGLCLDMDVGELLSIPPTIAPAATAAEPNAVTFDVSDKYTRSILNKWLIEINTGVSAVLGITIDNKVLPFITKQDTTEIAMALKDNLRYINITREAMLHLEYDLNDGLGTVVLRLA